jgi:hypothetical protein
MGKSFHTHLLSRLFRAKHRPKGHGDLTHSSRFGAWFRGGGWKAIAPSALGLMALVMPISGCSNFSNAGNNLPPASNSVPSPNSATGSSGTGSSPSVNPSSNPSPSDDVTLTESLYLDELLQQGFTSKDFWQIRFEHLYITFDGKGRTIDLSDGDEPLGTILSQWQGNETSTNQEGNATKAKSGQLSGRIIKATSGPSQGYGIYFQGKAYRESNRVSFTLKFEQDFRVKCSAPGAAKSKSDAALSLRLENLFGDARLPATGNVNQTALGFDPLAELAEKETLVIDMATLRQRLSPESFATLEKQLGQLIYLGDQSCETKPEL